MSLGELNLKMAQARTAELRRRAATPRRVGSTGGTAPSLAGAVPLTIRYADSLDDAALVTLAALDSAPVLVLPALVAEVEGELRAAISLVDAKAVADPFCATAELLELLRARAAQLHAEQHTGWRARLTAPRRLARALRLELRGLGSGGH